MAIRYTTAAEVSGSSKSKMLIYGRAGSGKTTLITTAPNPLLLSIDRGERSLYNGGEMPVWQFDNVDDMMTILDHIEEGYAADYETICLDSISEVAEQIFAEERKKDKDPRRLYPATRARVAAIMRRLRNLVDHNVVVLAKQGEKQDEFDGVTRYYADLPGAGAANDSMHMFDYAFCLHRPTDYDVPVLLCHKTETHNCKQRGDVVAAVEPADLSALFSKLGGK